jgi:formylglycine-generating enzyme required for sulfatase activity
VPGIGVEFVHVPAGEFQMGFGGGRDDERPARKIRLSHGFWIGKYELTQEELASLMGYVAGTATGRRDPVSKISWYEAKSYCRLLTERERMAGRLPAGYVYRLPVEAEWECAARGGPGSFGRIFPGSSDPDEVACYADNSRGGPEAVGGRKANELGIHDMAGNVAEMCWDLYDREHYSHCPVVDPVGLDGEFGALRGGSWKSDRDRLRTTSRDAFFGRLRSDGVGMRLCLGPRVGPEGMEPTPEDGGMEPLPPPVAKLTGEAGGDGPSDGAWRVPGIGMDFVRVEAGSFQMGSTRRTPGARQDEMPQHPVRISRPYWIGKCEVTNGQYRALMGPPPATADGDAPLPEELGQLPRLVDWHDAMRFCVRLTGREALAGRLPEGYEYRLPTEAEWEFAARGGTESQGYVYSGSNDLDEVAWCEPERSWNRPKPKAPEITKAEHPEWLRRKRELRARMEQETTEDRFLVWLGRELDRIYTAEDPETQTMASAAWREFDMAMTVGAALGIVAKHELLKEKSKSRPASPRQVPARPVETVKNSQAVGGKKPNELGIHDMSGNAPEWCLDRYRADFYASSPEVDPVCMLASDQEESYVGVIRGAGAPTGFVTPYTFELGWRTDAGVANRRSRSRTLYRKFEGQASAGFRVCLAPIIRYQEPR